MKKRMFWSIFKLAWEASFTAKNIINGFAKCGIWPIDSNKVCGLLPQPKPIPKTPTHDPNTPMSCRALRKMERSYKRSPTTIKLSLVFHSLHKLAAQHSIDNHINRGLRTTLIDQKKRKAKRRNLNLCGEEAGKPEFWNSEKVLAANQYQEEQDAQAKAKELQIADKKAKAAANKIQKELLKEEAATRRAGREQAWKLLAEQKLQAKLD